MTDHDHSRGADGAHDDVGSVTEETARLLGALGDWAKDQGAAYAGSAGASAAGLGEALRAVDQHVATGAAECRYCPVCLVVAKVRATSPEIRDHLSAAAGSFAAAVAGMLATPVPDDGRADRSGPVERIDLEGDDFGDDPFDDDDANDDQGDLGNQGSERA